ncbi:hypothetical protein [Paractinoplanes toevensis]|uniref:FtsK domain-containing protein n=1 Tax=Paractinoplanes toevensis TaxID=571911 RepID=A0A919T4Y0_9ACTN|nr:hypothetical protein [Actinoplanes toevensis]GIM88732.1 hypothetical protein Ato02nite_005250 [Actinoplanes toevensis]
MAAPTTAPRQPAPPSATRPPAGAAKLTKIYLDDKGIPQRSLTPVPVDENDRRTPHLQYQCPYLKTVNGGGKERCSTKEWLLPDDDAPFCPRHGKQLEPEKSGPSALEQTVRDALRLHGRSAAPWLGPAAAGVYDVGAHLGGLGTLETGAAVPALAAGTYVIARRTLTARALKRGRIERGQKAGRRILALKGEARRYAWYAGEAGLWLAALAGTDVFHLPGLIVAGLGMARWAFASRTWWQNAEQRRNRAAEVTVDTTQAATTPAAEAPDPDRLRALTTWATLIGCVGGPLAGTELVDFTKLPACEVNTASRTMLPNWSAKVVAKVEGSINMREPRPNLLGRIAAAFRCTYADVSFSADESDLSIGWLRVQPDNPLAETRMWTGPAATDWKAGRSIVGRFDDGAALLYQWWTKTGAVHDLISGCTGSGKSELVAQLLLASLHSNGLVIDWVGDPQGGQSYGALKDAVDWFARDKSEIKLMLLAAVKEMQRRNDELSRNNIKTWSASTAMPLLVITLDEVQSYIDDPDILALVEMLVGQARKCGIKMRLITQIPAAYNLGGSTYIKEQLKAGQTLIFRAMTDVAGRSATDGDVPVDPTMLPLVWGKNTCAAGESTAGLMFAQGLNGRDVYGRADYTGERMEKWLVDSAGDPSVNPGLFGPEAQRESGVLWGDRKERAAKLLKAGRSDADLLPGGRALELIEQASAAWDPLAADGSPVEAAPPKAPDGAKAKVLAACRELTVEHGRAEKKAVVARVKGQVAETTVTSALTDLLETGAIRRISFGVYEVPGVARAPQLPFEEATA